MATETKRVCFLLNNEFISDFRVFREAKALVAQGYEVFVFCIRAADDQEYPKYDEKEGIHIHRIFRKRFHNFYWGWEDIIRGYFRVAYKYPKFDVVHAHDANTIALGWELAKKWNARFVYDSHEMWESLFDEEKKKLEQNTDEPKRIKKYFTLKPFGLIPVLRNLSFRYEHNTVLSPKAQLKAIDRAKAVEARLIPRAHHVITVSESIGKKITERVDSQIADMTIVRNIPPYYQSQSAHKKRFHDEFNLPPETRILLYQGGLTKIRGILELLDAVENLQTPDVALVMMGPISKNHGFDKQVMDRIYMSNNLRRRVFYKSAVPVDELLSWTECADLGVHPILKCRDNHLYCLPNKLFEYIQAELPMAVTDVVEMKNIVDHYGVGYTFDSSHSQNITDAIDYFFANPHEHARLKENLAKAKQQLNWENEQQALIKAYSTLLNRPFTPLESQLDVPETSRVEKEKVVL